MAGKQKRQRVFELREGKSQKTGEPYLYLEPNVGDNKYAVKSINIELQDGTVVELNKRNKLFMNNLRDNNLRMAKAGVITEDEAKQRNANLPEFILEEAVLNLN